MKYFSLLAILLAVLAGGILIGDSWTWKDSKLLAAGLLVWAIAVGAAVFMIIYWESQ